MATAAELSIWIKGKDDASGVLASIKQHAGGLGSALSDIGKIGTGFALGNAITSAPGFLMDAAQAAADEQAAIARLQTAVQNTGAAWADYGSRMEGVVDKGISLGFADDDTRSSLALLTAQTSDAEEAMRRYGLAQDLSRGANIDLVTASKLLGKVTDENVNVLARYGIKAQEGMDQTELFGLIQQKFGGQAEAFAKSTAGQMATAKLNMQELKETIGYAVLPILTELTKQMAAGMEKVRPHLERVSAWFQENLPTAIAKAKEVWQQLEPVRETFTIGLRTLLEVGQKIVGWLAEHREALIALGVALGIVVIALNPIPAAILGVILAIGYLRDNWDMIKAKTLEVWNAISSFLDERLPYLKELVVGTFNMIRDDVERAITLVRDIVNVVMALLRGDWGEAWAAIKTLASDALEGLKTAITDRISVIADLMRFLGAAAVNAFTGAFSALGGAISSIFWGTVAPVLQKIITAYNDSIGRIPGVPNIPDLITGSGTYSGHAYREGWEGGAALGPPAPEAGYSGHAYMESRAITNNRQSVYIAQFVANGDPREVLAALGASL